MGASSLGHFNLPPNLRIINASAFENCTALQSMGNIPNSLQYIGDAAFSSCSSLQELILNDTALGYFGHRGCRNATSLTTVSFPPTLRYVGVLAFSMCLSLRSVTFDARAVGVVLAPGAFERTSIPELILPNQTALSTFSVAGIPALETIIAHNVSSMNALSFSGCNCNSSCPEALDVQGDIKICGCGSCETNVSLPNLPNRRTVTHIMDQFFLKNPPLDEMIKVPLDYVSNTTIQDQATPDDMADMALAAIAFVQVISEASAQGYVVTAKGILQVVQLLHAFDRLIIRMIARGVAVTSTVSNFLQTVGEFSEVLISIGGANQSLLSVPLAATLEEAMQNATRFMISLGQTGSLEFATKNTKVAVQVIDVSILSSQQNQV